MSLETSREAIREWSALIKATPVAQKPEATAEYANFDTDNQVTNKMATLQAFLYDLRRRVYDMEVFQQMREADIPVPVNPPVPAPAPNPHVAAHLPTIEVPHFGGGSVTEWLNWWADYKTLVHEQDKFSTLTKFNYLKDALKDEPALLIQGLAHTDANYIVAIDTLTSNYYSDALAKHELILKLQNLPSCRNLEEAGHFSLQVNIICRQLTTLGLGNEVESLFVASMLEAKLPLFLMRRIQEQQKKATLADPWTTTRFRTLLSEYILDEKNLIRMRNIELGDNNDSKGKDKKPVTPKKPSPPKKEKDQSVTYSAKESIKSQAKPKEGGHSSSGKGNSLKSPKPGTKSGPQTSFSSTCHKCNFCLETTHYGSQCKKFSSLASREKRAYELKLCLRCLSVRHPTRDCSTVLRDCLLCRGPHHTALCDKPKEKTSASKSEPHISENGDESQNSDEYSLSVVPSFRFGTAPTMRLLMCCKVVAYNLDLPKHRQPIVIFLDTGSHRTFISEQLSHKLKLRSSHLEHFSLGVFGQSGVVAHKAKLHCLGLETMEGVHSKSKQVQVPQS